MGNHSTHNASRRSRQLLIYTAIASILVSAPHVLPITPWLRIYTMTGLWVMLAMGLNVTAGFAGILDLAYVAFFGMGGYLFALLSSGWFDVHLPFLIALPLAAFTSMAVGFLLGLTGVRLKREYLVIVTFAFAQIFRLLLLNLDRPVNITGGMHGISAFDPIRLLGFTLTTPVAYAYVIWLAAAAVVAGCFRLKGSYYGLGWKAVREDGPAAESLGINTSLMKLKAFAGGAFIAGATGALFASFQDSVFPDHFDFPQLVILYCMLVLGGRGNVTGVILGAVLFSILYEVLGDAGAYRVILFSFILIVLTCLRPQGILGVTGFTRKTRTGKDETGVTGAAWDLCRPRQAPGVISPKGVCSKGTRVILQVKEVSLNFGGLVALENVSLDIWEREIVTIIGPNGAGKTTLLNIVSGYYPASSGAVLYRGRNLSGLKPHRIVKAGIARTFQNPRLFNTMTVLENAMVAQFFRTRSGASSILLGLPLPRKEQADTVRTVKEVLALFGQSLSGDRLSRKALSLSHTNRRRLEMARAIATGPRVLMLDEPSAGMSPREVKRLADLIGRLRDEHGCTIILVEHNLGAASSISDRVIALAFGRKIAEGSYKEVADNPSVLNAFFGNKKLLPKDSPTPC